jgi:hypothetical protein
MGGTKSMLKIHEPERKGMDIKDYESRVKDTRRTLKRAMADQGAPVECKDATAWILKAHELAPSEFSRFLYACDALQFFKDVVRIEALREEQNTAAM